MTDCWNFIINLTNFNRLSSLGVMKKYILSLGLTIILLTSCKLTTNLINVVKAYDLDNNGNSSDIRVDFNVTNNNNVTEYRIMVVPSNNSNSFDVGNAITLPEERYLEINPNIFENKYSITRLPSNFIDVNGEQIQVNLEYVVAVLVVGTGNHQLSEFSRPLTLRIQEIYTGDYNGVWVSEVTANPGTICPDKFEFFVSATITGTIQESYRGRIICTDPICDPDFINQGPVSFTIANNIISNFLQTQTIPCYQDPPCTSCVFGVDPCPASFTGQGIVIGDLSFEISFSGDDCVGSHEITLTLFRQ